MPDNYDEALDRIREYYRQKSMSRLTPTYPFIGPEKLLYLLEDNNINLPNVPRPSMFQRDPLVVGSPANATMAKNILDLDPKTKSNVSSVTFGPTKGSMDEMVRSNINPGHFEGTSLLGVYGLDNHAIGVQPGMSQKENLDTLIHEIAHAAGYGESGAQKAESIFFKKAK